MYEGFTDSAAVPDPKRLGKQRVEALQVFLPPWLGDSAFHRSHQSALRRKDPAYYGPHFPDVSDDLPYLWPASDRESGEGG